MGMYFYEMEMVTDCIGYELILFHYCQFHSYPIHDCKCKTKCQKLNHTKHKEKKKPGIIVDEYVRRMPYGFRHR